MKEDNFMERLLKKENIKEDVTKNTVENSDAQVVHYAGEDKADKTLKVYISPEKILSEDELNEEVTEDELSEEVKMEEMYSWLDIEDPDEITPEMMMQMQKAFLGFKTDKEVIEYTIHLGEYLNLLPKKFEEIRDKMAKESVIKKIFYNPTLSSTFQYTTEKIMNEMFLKDAPTKNKLSTFSKKDNVYITYELSELELEDGYEISSPLEPIDRDLIEAIGNLLKNSGTPCLKLITIYRELTHNPKATMTANIEENLLTMLKRCASKRLILNAKKEKEHAEKESEWQGLKHESYFNEQVLNWRAAKGQSFGFSDDDMYIEFLTYPVLLRYAEAKGNVRTIESNILNVKGVKNTNENIVIRNYLSREIKWMKTGKRTRRVGGKTVLNNAVSFDTVLEYAGISDLKGVERQRKKDVIEKILNYWTDCKWIDGFTTDKASRTSPVKGFTIKLSKKTMDS